MYLGICINQVSRRQYDTCSLSELDCFCYGFSEQTQFSQSAYLQTNNHIRYLYHKKNNKTFNLLVQRRTDLKDFAFNSALHISAHMCN